MITSRVLEPLEEFRVRIFIELELHEIAFEFQLRLATL